MNSTLKAYIQLCRPANLPTAAADILAGAGIVMGISLVAEQGPAVPWSSMEIPLGDLILLCLSSIFLYAGGVVLNDFFDADLDAVERPERPIPSGQVSRAAVLRFGLILILIGIGLAVLCRPESGAIAFALSGMIVLYDWKAKHTALGGPLAMGSCRALNLLLGMSLLPVAPIGYYLAIPLLFIGAITAISQGEVKGGKRKTQSLAAVLYALVGALLLFWAVEAKAHWWWTAGLLGFFYALVGPPLVQAWKNPEAKNIRKAVKWGVISLIVLDAAMASAFVSPFYTLIILGLLPLSRALSKVFAVT